MVILIIAAHPDDEILGCFGATTKLEEQGHKISTVILGKGRGAALDNQFDKMALLHWTQIVEANIEKHKPTIIFTHYEKDLNIDHRITYQAVITAARPLPNCCVKEIYSFEILSSTEWSFPLSFSPDVFWSFSKEILYLKQSKLREKYSKEMREYPHPRSYAGVEILARYRGMQFGHEFAEAFKTVWIYQ